MPNPKHAPRWPNIRMDEHLGFASHVRITCQVPKDSGRCGHQVIMATRMLYEIVPGAVTCADFHKRLRCSRCRAKGWAVIEAAGR
jgi:hypothetical protein